MKINNKHISIIQGVQFLWLNLNRETGMEPQQLYSVRGLGAQWAMLLSHQGPPFLSLIP
jgi:hypothetical protein